MLLLHWRTVGNVIRILITSGSGNIMLLRGRQLTLLRLLLMPHRLLHRLLTLLRLLTGRMLPLARLLLLQCTLLLKGWMLCSGRQHPWRGVCILPIDVLGFPPW